MLSNKILLHKFNHPILTASGTYGYGDEVKDIVDIDKLGGIVTKSVTLHPREGNHPPRIAETASGMLNSIGLANLGVDQYIKTKIPHLNELNTNVIINIAGSMIDDYLQTLEKLEAAESNHIGYEINISCPNVKKGGMEFGLNKEISQKLTSELRKLTSKLLIIKLSPNVTNIEEIGLFVQKGGDDVISAVNTFSGLAIDYKTGKMMLSTISTNFLLNPSVGHYSTSFISS